MSATLKLEEVPERGDIVWLDFDPQVGHEQAKRRPALVLSPVEYNRFSGLALVCPITSKIKGFSFEVPVPPGLLKEKSVTMSDQIKSLDWRARKAEFIGKASQPTLDEVFARIVTLLQ